MEIPSSRPTARNRMKSHDMLTLVPTRRTGERSADTAAVPHQQHATPAGRFGECEKKRKHPPVLATISVPWAASFCLILMHIKLLECPLIYCIPLGCHSPINAWVFSQATPKTHKNASCHDLDYQPPSVMRSRTRASWWPWRSATVSDTVAVQGISRRTWARGAPALKGAREAEVRG